MQNRKSGRIKEKEEKGKNRKKDQREKEKRKKEKQCSAFGIICKGTLHMFVGICQMVAR